MFVSPLMTIPKMQQVFSEIKEKGKILAVDMTKAKNREKIEDLAELLPYIDYIFPNEAEIALLTGEKDPKRNAERLLEMGVKTAVIKCGEKGCVLGDETGIYLVPAVPVQKCVDTTGAGDAFCAGVSAGLTYGKSLPEAIDIGSLLAASVITSSENVCPRFLPREVGIDIDVID